MTFLSYIGDDPAKIRTMAGEVFATIHMLQSDPKMAISRVNDIEIALRCYAELLENLEEIKAKEFENGFNVGRESGYWEGYDSGVDR